MWGAFFNVPSGCRAQMMECFLALMWFHWLKLHSKAQGEGEMIISEEDKWNWCFQVWLGHLYKKTGSVFGMKERDRIFAVWLGYPPHFQHTRVMKHLGSEIFPQTHFPWKKRHASNLYVYGTYRLEVWKIVTNNSRFIQFRKRSGGEPSA